MNVAKVLTDARQDTRPFCGVERTSLHVLAETLLDAYQDLSEGDTLAAFNRLGRVKDLATTIRVPGGVSE